MKVNTNIAAAAAKNSIIIVPTSKWLAENASILLAIILGINMLVALPSNAMIIKTITVPEYGFSKLNMPGLEILWSEDFAAALSIFI
jgi:hypothetical protein